MTERDPRSLSTFGIWKYLLPTVGAIAIIGGVWVLVTGTVDRLLGVALIAMGAGFVCVFMGEEVPLDNSGMSVDVVDLAGSPRHVFLFRPSADRLAWFSVASACVALFAGIGIFIAPQIADSEGKEDLIRIAAPLLTIIGAASAIGFWRARTASYIALSPEGLWAQGFLGETRVAWESIVESAVFEAPAQRGTRNIALGVNVADGAQIKSEKVLGVLSGFDRNLHGWDLSFSVTTMGFDPRILAAAIDHYAKDPAGRTNIGRAEELERVKRLVA